MRNVHFLSEIAFVAIVTFYFLSFFSQIDLNFSNVLLVIFIFKCVRSAKLRRGFYDISMMSNDPRVTTQAQVY